MVNYFMNTCLLIIFLFTEVVNLNAQSSFDLRVDGLASGAFSHFEGHKIVHCVDGGFFMTGTIGNKNNFILKTDSVGQIEWSYKLNPSFYRGPADIIPTNDSGFYFMRNNFDGHFNAYCSPSIAKVDKFGNVVKSKLIPFSQFYEGHEITFCEVDSSNNDVLLAGMFSEYNGTNGSCCYQLYAFKMDSSLNVVFSTRLDNAVPGQFASTGFNLEKVYLSNQTSGYIVTGVVDFPGFDKTFVYFLDSIGTVVWVKSFNGLLIKDVEQVGNNLFFLSTRSVVGPTYSSKIIKTDLAGNTISAKEVQLSGNLFFDRIEKNSSNELIISGVHSSTPFTYSDLFLLADTSCNVIFAKIGPPGGSVGPFLYLNSRLPIGHLNSILLARYDSLGRAVFEKIHLTNLFCNYTDLTVSTIPVVVVDSISNFSTIPYPLPFVGDTMTFIPEFFNYSSPCLSSGIEDTDKDENQQGIGIFPNPATEFIDLVIDELLGKSYQATVFNITGEAVLKLEMDSSDREIPVTELPLGIYFVNVVADNKQYNSKFVKL